jgi:hypothetical protein
MLKLSTGPDRHHFFGPWIDFAGGLSFVLFQRFGIHEKGHTQTGCARALKSCAYPLYTPTALVRCQSPADWRVGGPSFAFCAKGGLPVLTPAPMLKAKYRSGSSLPLGHGLILLQAYPLRFFKGSAFTKKGTPKPGAPVL